MEGLAVEYQVGDKIRVVDPDIISELQEEHASLRKLETIEGFVFEAGWAYHPMGNADQEQDKFQSLEVILQTGSYTPMKDYWCEKLEDSEYPSCSGCSNPTKNWIGNRWSCVSCEEESDD